MNSEQIRQKVRDRLPETVELLKKLIEYPSIPGCEGEAMVFLENWLKQRNIPVKRVALDNSIKEDADYSGPIAGIDYSGHFNLRTEQLAKNGDGLSLVLNAHMDVVPASEGMTDAFVAREQDGIVFGRGACDDKGPLACMCLVLSVLAECSEKWQGKVVGHFVVEEENGGNGSLAMARRGEQADACIVFEPSDRGIYTSIRGAVWFRLVCHGTAGHSGQSQATQSALLKAHQAMSALLEYHRKLLDESRGDSLFDVYANPMPLTFGKLEAGNWPAAAPGRAVLEGVLGFLPNRSKEEICQEMYQVLISQPGWSEKDFELSFTYRHDCSVVEVSHPLPSGLMNAAVEMGNKLNFCAFPASCDAWFYNNIAGIPTIVYGPGNLRYAHSKDEQIIVEDIRIAAENILSFIL